MDTRSRAIAAVVAIALFPACGNDEPEVVASATVPRTSAATVTASGSSTPSGSATVTPTATPTSTSSAVPPSTDPSGVLTGRLGVNFVAVFEADGVRQLGLFEKTTGKLVNDLGASVGAGDAQPQASPDGASIYFLHGSGEACDSGVYRVPVAGGGAERVVDPREQIDAFALNADGTKLMAVRHLGCGGAATKRLLTEFDALTGAVVDDRAAISGDDTAVTALAWHERSGQVALTRTGKGSIDMVETFGLLGEGTTKPARLELPKCLGRIRGVQFTDRALYVARDCMNPENADKAGHIYRALDSDDVERIVATDSGTTVAGMYAGRSGDVMFSTLRWLEEDDEGPTTVYSVSDGSPTKLFETPQKLTELVW